MTVAVRERPILFSGPMVRAILDGRKTMTRRVVQVSHIPADTRTLRWENQTAEELQHVARCPYGVVGDQLWVRETWQSPAAMNICHVADDWTVYRATDPDWSDMEGWKWRPGIFMPRDRSRLALEITGVRVERLAAISDSDAIAEGIDGVCHCGDLEQNHNAYSGHAPVLMNCPTTDFSNLWDSINGKRPGCTWADNPWVWVISFRRIDHV